MTTLQALNDIAVTGVAAADTVIETDGGNYALTLPASGTNTLTLGAPRQAGSLLNLEVVAGTGGDFTLALTNVVNESAGTTATFNADGEGMLLLSTSDAWCVLAEYGGVTLA